MKKLLSLVSIILFFAINVFAQADPAPRQYLINDPSSHTTKIAKDTAFTPTYINYRFSSKVDTSSRFPLGLIYPLELASDTSARISQSYLDSIWGASGTATLVAGTVTISCLQLTSGSKIFVSVNTPGGTRGYLSVPNSSRIPGTSFVINSSSSAETSTVDWKVSN